MTDSASLCLSRYICNALAERLGLLSCWKMKYCMVDQNMTVQLFIHDSINCLQVFQRHWLKCSTKPWQRLHYVSADPPCCTSLLTSLIYTDDIAEQSGLIILEEAELQQCLDVNPEASQQNIAQTITQPLLICFLSIVHHGARTVTFTYPATHVIKK